MLIFTVCVYRSFCGDGVNCLARACGRAVIIPSRFEPDPCRAGHWNLSCEKKFIGNLLEEKIGKIVGKIFKINSSQLFQLSAHINDTFFNKHLVYIGDSAHSIHPIAGQGWNLGIKDVINLHTLANEYGDDIGSNSFCKSYNNLSYNKAFQLFQITDKLNLHFKNKSNLYRLFSYGGFKLIQNTNALKNQIAKYAMGI